MTWTLYKEIKYATDGIPAENLTDFPKLVSITADADIAAELGSGGGIKFTSSDGLTDLAFGLYPSTDLASGTVLARVKVTLLTAASVGDVICRLYYSSTETTTEDKAGTVDNSYALFMPLEEDPSGSSPQMRDWVTDTLLGASGGSMTSGDLVASQVGDGLDLDGSDDVISLSIPTKTADAYTFSLWFNWSLTTSVSRDGAVLWDNFNSLMWIYNGANFQWRHRNASFTYVDLTFSLGQDVGVGHHYAASCDGSNAAIYLDGALDGGPTAISGIAYDTGDTTGRVASSSIGIAGIADELQISSVARSAEWIAYTFTDDSDNASTFTLGAEQGGGAGSSVIPGTAALTLTAFAPAVSVSDQQTVTPGTAALTLTAFAPTVSLSDHQTVTPGTAALTLTAFAPTVSVSDQQAVTPGTAALTLTAFAPTVSLSDHQTVTPSAAALTLTAFAPTVSLSDQKTATPGTAALTLTAFAPAVTTGGNQEVTPTTAALALGAFAPTVTASDHQNVTPGTAGLMLNTFAPTIAATANQRITPRTAALSLATFSPAVTTSGHQTVTPGTAALTLATFAPTVLQLFPTTESFVRPRLFETQVGPRLFETQV